ncbi:unnamed protein product [Haemonchus placei]|uniref:Photosystem II reaction center protein T n=1 Tax=Haemonchus placei TaxID=6290 RepID=A0A0N4WBE8_HAEPC|nr:unnamed protein product [Haemonchus placei]
MVQLALLAATIYALIFSSFLIEAKPPMTRYVSSRLSFHELLNGGSLGPQSLKEVQIGHRAMVQLALLAAAIYALIFRLPRGFLEFKAGIGNTSVKKRFKIG